MEEQKKKQTNPFMAGYQQEPGTHSKAYTFIENQLGFGGSKNQLTQKQKYEQQKQKLSQRLENMNYKNKVQEIQIANRKLTQARINEFKRKIGFS